MFVLTPTDAFKFDSKEKQRASLTNVFLLTKLRFLSESFFKPTIQVDNILHDVYTLSMKVQITITKPD